MNTAHTDHTLLQLEAMFTAKLQYFEYAVLTCSADKMLGAIEEVDEVLDFIALHLEYLSFFRDQASVEESKIEEVLLDHREMFFILIEDVTKQFIKHLNEPGLMTPMLTEFKDELVGYLKFKLAANSIYLGDKERQVNLIAAQFHKVYRTVNEQGLQELWDKAAEEISKGWPSTYQRLTPNWQHEISYCDRSLLEQQDIFRVSQSKRHRVFHKLGKTQDGISGFFSKLYRRASGETNQQIQPSEKGVYLTPSLDRYLCARDLRANMVRKWARFIPLRMSNYLIKVYNEPAYWDSTHLLLAKLDHQRLGFAYYQKAMEVGKKSEYSEILLKKALHGFRRAEVEIPSKLMDKLGWA